MSARIEASLDLDKLNQLKKDNLLQKQRIASLRSMMKSIDSSRDEIVLILSQAEESSQKFKSLDRALRNKLTSISFIFAMVSIVGIVILMLAK